MCLLYCFVLVGCYFLSEIIMLDLFTFHECKHMYIAPDIAVEYSEQNLSSLDRKVMKSTVEMERKIYLDVWQKCDH